ncbi:unnamed protein product [Acanthoscelides obtectus]|uniref:Ribosomal protein n=1 Tax=Acanthoscelides obtectus TaxID=200917 RepID=A0A9P0PDB9_ACAOB|nr:unnamed protein product [Acanthoscelides obtectus]CAK1659049.1 39S ribosomal protein L36, mitochondrial [Acanthoscelides obtectus]
MFPIFRNAITIAARRLPSATGHLVATSFHILSKPSIISALQPGFLTPALQTVVPSCGMKVRGRLRRRCKDCYFVMREGRLYVMCKTHGRHKQMSMVKDPKNTWILSHATQGKVRPW